nr:MAG TPA: hypothetical protein [Bacteriophage sp.]
MERKLTERHENQADRYAGVCNIDRSNELF